MTANSQQPTTAPAPETPAASIAGPPARDGKIVGRKQRILVFDDQSQALEDCVEYFKMVGYDAVGVKVVNDAGDLNSEGTLKRPVSEKFIHGVYTPENVKSLLKQFQPDVVLTDGQWLNGKIFSAEPTIGGIGGGVGLYDIVREHDPNIPCVLHTGARGRLPKGVHDEQIGEHTYKIASKQHGSGHIREYFDQKLAQGRRVE